VLAVFSVVPGNDELRRWRILLFPTDLTSFLDLIREHGTAAYAFMFSYAASHSLLFGLFGGYAAKAGAFSFGTLVAVCWVGSFLGDVLRFWVGRRYGSGLISGYPRIEAAVQKAALLADRHHTWMILLHRFPHGIRGVAGIAYGMSRLRWPKFLMLNFIAAGLWATAVVSAGYGFGHLSEKVMNDASSTLGLGMLVIFLGLSWVVSKKLEQAIERT
jgi:membrane protein DedA with SNARE-associated domain